MSVSKRILILVHKEIIGPAGSWNSFQSAMRAAVGEKAAVTIGELTELTIELNTLESKIYDRHRGFSLDEFDLVVFRGAYRDSARASTCASHLIKNNIPYIDHKIHPASLSKDSAMAKRQLSGLAAIPTIHASPDLLLEIIRQEELPFKYPITLKDNNGQKGQLNFKANTQDEAVDILQKNHDVDFILQSFIPNDGDYRILVLGGEPQVVIYRQAQEGSHLNNVSQGADAKLLPVDSVDPQILEIAVQAAKVEQLEVAGVDIVINKLTGEHFVLEVNSSPQITSGAFPEEKMAAYGAYLNSLV